MKSSVLAFGLVMQVFPNLLSTPIPLPYCLGLRQRLFVPLQHFIALIGESSFYCTIPSILQVLLDFYWTTYEAGAKLGHWDREALERKRENWDGSKVGVGEWRNNIVFRP